MFLDLVVLALIVTAPFALMALVEAVMERSEWFQGLFAALGEDIRNLGR